MRSGLSACFLVPALFALSSSVHAASLTIQWDPPTDARITGFIVYFGTVSGTYTSQVDAGFVTSYRVEGLADDTRYCFAVRAYAGSTEVSDLSTEVCGSTAPIVSSSPTTTVSAPATSTSSGGGGGAASTGGGGGGASSGGASSTESAPATPAPSVSQPGSSAPRAFAAVPAAATTSVRLSWQAPADGLGASAYEAHVGSSPGASDLLRTSVTAMALDVHGLREGGTYYMRVRAVRGGATGDFSPELTVTVAVGRSVCAAPPATPTSFETSTSGALVQLMWQPGTGAAPTGYMLYVGSAPGRQDYLTAPLGPIPALSATAGEGVYYLRLFAMNACGTSPGGVDSVVGVGAAAAALLSGGAASAPSTALPGAPESLTQQVIGQTVTLRWAPPSTGGAPTRYILEAMTAGGPVAVDTGAATGFTHPNTPSGTYVIRVRAANGRGVGPASAPVTVVVP